MLRAATIRDLTTFADIERAAGEMFRTLGMDLVADDAPATPAELRAYVDADHAWVIAPDGDIAGYLLADVVDDCAHIEQVTVHPRNRGHRFGAALIDHLAARARAERLAALTLTTYREVPWNGPYYATRGFRWLGDDEVTPGLRAIRVRERDKGLDCRPRGCMRRDLS